jgi:RNA polymerase sigma-70 factor (ECF subfamily)
LLESDGKVVRRIQKFRNTLEDVKRMSDFEERNSEPPNDAYTRLRDAFGFVPNPFTKLSSKPLILDVCADLLIAVLCSNGDLSRIQKESIGLITARVRNSAYGVTFHAQNLHALGVGRHQLDRLLAYSPPDISTRQTALMDLAIALSREPASQVTAQAVTPISVGWPALAVLDAVLATAASSLLCELAEATYAVPDFLPIEIQPVGNGPVTDWHEKPLHSILPLCGERFANMPKLFQVQASRPDVVAVEFQAWQCIPQAQVADSLDVTPLFEFFRIVACGLGLPGQSPALPTSSSKLLHPATADSRPSERKADDPDNELVTRAKEGDLSAFSELVHLYSRRIYRTLVGLLGDPDEALDALQETFLKAFQGLSQFQGRSRFSTWIVAIATNTGIQRLRERVPCESLDEDAQDREAFRPKQIQAWTDNPEQLYSKQQTRLLVETAVRRLPAKYRVVVMLRDIEGASTEEAAVVLRLSIPALKARLLRGRLMLRETLATHFKSETAGVLL